MSATVTTIAFEGPLRTVQVRFSDAWTGVYAPGDDLWEDRGGHVLPPHVVAMLDAEWTLDVRRAYAAHVARIEEEQRAAVTEPPGDPPPNPLGAILEALERLNARMDRVEKNNAARPEDPR